MSGLLKLFCILQIVAIAPVFGLDSIDTQCELDKDGHRYLSCEKKQLQKVPNNLQKDIQKFSLAYNKITNIQKNSFEPYREIKYLDLSHNLIKSIEAGSFAYLTHLVELNVSHNKLTEFKQVMPPLDVLRLDNNPLKEFDAGKNIIKILLLDNTEITEIPKIHMMHSLLKVVLKSNRINGYITDDLVPFCKLATLTIANNEHSTKDLVDKCSCVRFNNLVHSPLGSKYEANYILGINKSPIYEVCLKHMKDTVNCKNSPETYNETTINLVDKCIEMAALSTKQCIKSYEGGRPTADCSNKELKHLPFNLDSDVSNLILSKNKYTVIGKAFFEQYSKLQKVILSENEIKVVDVEAFKGLQNLEHIDLSQNNLTHLIDNIPMSVTVLNLNNNQIRDFPHNPTQRNKVTELHLANNEITEIDAHFIQNFPNLEFLHLSSNKISVIEEGVLVCLRDLKYLDMSNNQLSTFEHVVNLKMLKLMYNPITKVDFGNSRIKQLDLSNTKIKEFPNLHGVAPDLTALSLKIDTMNAPTLRDIYPLCALTDLNLSNKTLAKIQKLKECRYIKHTNVTINLGDCYKNKIWEFGWTEFDKYVSKNGVKQLRDECVNVRDSGNRTNIYNEYLNTCPQLLGKDDTEDQQTSTETTTNQMTESTETPTETTILETTTSDATIGTTELDLTTSTEEVQDLNTNFAAHTNERNKQQYMVSFSWTVNKGRNSSNAVSMSTSLFFVLMLMYFGL